MLRHLVLLRFKDTATASDIAGIEAAFCALKLRIETVREIEWGTNVSPEGLAQGFSHAFLLSFDDAAGRDVYLPHPAHQAFVEQLQPFLEQALVLDYEAASSSLH